MVGKGSFSKRNCCPWRTIERIVSFYIGLCAGGVDVFREDLYRCRASDPAGIAGSAQSEVIDQVTVTLGYMQMSSRKIARYDIELRAAVEGLLELASAEHRKELTGTLEGLERQMDQELAS